MKFIIKNAKEKESEPEVELWLESGINRIYLMGKDKTGKKNYLMAFQNGKFSRIALIELEGLETDKYGRITEE